MTLFPFWNNRFQVSRALHSGRNCGSSGMSRFDALLALVSCGADALESGPNAMSGDDDTTTETSSLACDDNKPTSSGGPASKKRKKSTAATSPSATRSRTVDAPSACADTASETASSSGGDYGDEGGGGGTENPIDSSDPKEAKKQRRLVRNRMSAQLHRERKKAYIDQLEEQLKSKDDECAKLRQLMDQLTRENDALREKIAPPVASTRRPAEAAN